MNEQDRKTIGVLFSKLDALDNKVDISDKQNLKLYHRIDKILMKLEDDPHSNSEGLITKVNRMEVDMIDVKSLHGFVKRASVFVLTITSGIVTYIVKDFLK